jgi:hypothetical protein
MSDVATIKPPDPIDWNNYDDRGTGKPLPPKGEYQLIPVAIDTKRRTKEGYFQATVDFKVVAPGQPFDGYLSRFNRFSTKKWREDANSNPAADYLRGFGMKGPFGSDAEYEKAIMATLNRPAKGLADWEIYDSATGFSLKRYEDFPTDDKGNKLTMVEKDKKKHFANVKVRYLVSTVAKKAA